jgi:nucleoside recognition membrane protein YjiH
MKLPLIVTISILVIIAFILKITWWNRLEDDSTATKEQQQENKIREHEYLI